MFLYRAKNVIAAASVALMSFAPVAHACTGITLTAQDGSIIRARTLEWGAFDLDGAISAIPAGYEMSSTMPDGSAGATWTTRYNVVGATGLGRVLVTDGINDAGLSGGLFYLPGFAEYPAFDPATSDISLAPTDVMNFILTQFATIDEVRAAMGEIRVVDVVEPALGFAAPVHFIVSDRSGETIVIEVVNQEMMIHDAPLGVVTNSPPYDWHITNLRNYINLTATELPTLTVDGDDFAALGSGSGLIGLPGDFTPPSRFVRAVAFTQTARETQGGIDTVRESFRILDNFNVPTHAVSGDDAGAHEGRPLLSATQFTTAADLENLRFYYHTQYDRSVRMVDMASVDFESMGGEPMTFPMDENIDANEDVREMSFQ